MCGRFTLTKSKQDVIRTFLVKQSSCLFNSNYNIAPHQSSPVIYIDSESTNVTLDNMQWGLIPFWAKNPLSDFNTINAKAETLSQKPTFKRSLSSRRCLIPTDGFYEWKKGNKLRQPYRIAKKDGSLFAMAGLWDEWISQDKSKNLKTFTIITTQANTLLFPIHNRMPVILPSSQWNMWLETHSQNILSLLTFLHPYKEDDLIAYPVTSLVNNPNNNMPSLILPLTP